MEQTTQSHRQSWWNSKHEGSRRHRRSVADAALIAVIGTGALMRAEDARACSPWDQPMQAGIEGAVGVRPLLVTDRDDARLAAVDDEGVESGTIEVVPVDAPEILDGVLSNAGKTLRYYRPLSDLEPGNYSFASSRFSVSSSVAEAGVVIRPATLELRIADPDDGGGCSNCGPPESGLFINLEGLMFTPEDRGGNSLVVVRAPAGGVVRRFLHTPLWSSYLYFGRGFDETGPFGTSPLCVAITPISYEGLVGETQDLGCVDPEDESDPRVRNERAGGCLVIRRNQPVPVVFLLLVTLAVVRYRARRAS